MGEDRRLTLEGNPRTKKNSQRIVARPNGARFIKPSAQYETYERNCLSQLYGKRWQLEGPLNLRCEYYMATRRKVDLCNLLEASCDILVKAGVIVDDNSTVVAGHDGSRVRYDKTNPRVEITIEEAQRWMN